MFAQFEKCVALPFVHLLQLKHVLIERDRLFHVVTSIAT